MNSDVRLENGLSHLEDSIEQLARAQSNAEHDGDRRAAMKIARAIRLIKRTYRAVQRELR